MLRRKLLFGVHTPVKFNPVPYRHFCTPEKPPKKDSPEDFEINISPKVIKRTLIGVVTVSWILLLKLWYGFEESTRNRATEYYEQGGSMDPSPPEEYRKEYAEKLKRKIKRQKEKGDKVSEVEFSTRE